MQRSLALVASAVLLMSSAPALVNAAARPESLLRTFAGHLMRHGNDFFLEEEVSDITFRLDDSQMVRDHEGKSVKLTGVLEEGKNLIHVVSIDGPSE